MTSITNNCYFRTNVYIYFMILTYHNFVWDKSPTFTSLEKQIRVDDCATRNPTQRIVKWFVRLRVSEKRRSSSSIQRSQRGFTSQLSFIVTPPRRLDAVMLNRLSCSQWRRRTGWIYRPFGKWRRNYIVDYGAWGRV